MSRLWHPHCSCERGKDILTALIEVTLPGGWQTMTEDRCNAFTVVKCAHCGATLKPYATVPFVNSRGETQVRTLLF